MGKYIIAGNWKMNKLPSETYDYVKEVAAATAGEIDDIIDASELRQRIGGAVMMLSAKSACAPTRRHANMPL